ncbi:MAG: hypothetical protein ACR2I7_11390 [Geodermatophilaceae bacterium]
MEITWCRALLESHAHRAGRGRFGEHDTVSDPAAQRKGLRARTPASSGGGGLGGCSTPTSSKVTWWPATDTR